MGRDDRLACPRRTAEPEDELFLIWVVSPIRENIVLEYPLTCSLRSFLFQLVHFLFRRPGCIQVRSKEVKISSEEIPTLMSYISLAFSVQTKFWTTCPGPIRQQLVLGHFSVPSKQRPKVSGTWSIHHGPR